jgi:hypothetical protein
MVRFCAADSNADLFYDEIDNFTISYNTMHDSWKTSLWGSSDSNADERRITFLLNHWQDGTGLINNNGMPRPAMTWLMSYLIR